ncbi:helix-turn-helix transcriptional regulator [Streptomyces sp. H27-C3]|uniref:helix-turn-helix domain-containing protein n=1 Tax=Streptomyces sp. H27-C3 TaxID=3046305 RepID=UPI0024B97EB2|nr:helix-turn-helix transcriptional regulator [Streptomyces sp. H27-C3]MDJ0466359.1 helix-turn-helix transcriptional regulator [Streptomyces sp. H27-C3]
MALRTTTTERQRRLGVELKKLREDAKLTAHEGGALIGMGRVHFTHVEGGNTAISAERIRTLCTSYGVTSSTYVDALVDLAEPSGKGWRNGYKGQIPPSAIDLAELESKATDLRSYESLFLPGLFQLEEYTRSIFQASDAVTTSEGIESAVRFRMQRQDVLTAGGAPTVHAVVHEAALHMRFGGAKVMRRQLLRLVELAELPHMTIQVFPFTADAVSALTTPFCHIGSHGGALETVLVEHPAESMFLHGSESVAKYRRQFDRLSAAALPPIDTAVLTVKQASRDSLGLIQHILYTLQEARS